MDFNSPVVLVLFLVALWFAVGIAVSFLSGWAELARIYRLHNNCGFVSAPGSVLIGDLSEP